MKALPRKLASFPVLLGAILVASVVVATQTKLPDPDVFLHAAVGKQILATGTWPALDTFSFTAQGNSSLAYEWLGQVLIALADRSGGLKGLMALLVAWSASLLLLLYYYAYLKSGNAKAAFVACLALWPLMILLFTLRPQLLGYSFLLITLICLEHFQRGRRAALWFLPVVFLLWVNTHGSFVLGLFAMGVYWVSGLLEFRHGRLEAKQWSLHERLQLEVVALLCVLSLTLTPYGTRLAAFPLEIIMNSSLGMAAVNEYKPVAAYPAVLLPFLLLLVLFALAQIIWRPRYTVHDLVFFVTTTYLAWTHLRFLFFFLLVFAPFVSAILGKWVPQYEVAKDRPALNAALILLMILGVVRLFPSRGQLQSIVDQQYPRQAVDYLRAHHVRGPMFNRDGWGSYLIWSAPPGHKVFIDTRSQLYEQAGVYADFIHILNVDPETPRVFRKYGLKSCLIARRDPLATYLAAQSDWRLAYQDSVSVIFVRQADEPAGDRWPGAKSPESTQMALSARVAGRPTT